MKKTYTTIFKAGIVLASLLMPAMAMAQQVDTTQIYGEKKDSLEATVKVGRQMGNFLSKGKDIRTEVISAAGLCKMACCNLAESFENSASVTVSYADAVTGARQIKLLGQSGIYTQMLDENRPVMRGLSAPFGLNYVPGQWLESIQIGKGVPSVINGVESMTGQINMEHRKPTDEKPLYIQASVMDDTKTDVNIASSLQLDDMGKWSTVILAHADANFMEMDHNKDGFIDDPLSKQFSLANRWLYYGLDGTQVRFGVKALMDNREGGRTSNYEWKRDWRTDIKNRQVNAYVKVGTPLNEDNSRNIAAVADYTFQSMNSKFDLTPYFAEQHSGFINLLYQDTSHESFNYTLGLSNMMDIYNESFLRILHANDLEVSSSQPIHSKGLILNDLGAFAEMTYHSGDKFTAILGLRGDLYNGAGFRFSPRITLKWAPSDAWVFRANAGRGIRYSNPIVDNIGMLSTGKIINGLADKDGNMMHPLEDSWTAGGNATWYVPFDESGKTYISFDYFHSMFTEQLLVDYSAERIDLYTLSSMRGSGRNPYSYTNNFQLDFSTEPLRGLTVTLTGRYTDARQSLLNQESDIKPMTSMYKAVLNLQYATRLNKWIFDFTASINGPCKVWDFMKDDMYKDGYTETYPLLYAQVTRRFKGFDIYAGVENITGFTQHNPIIGYEDPWSSKFDASCVWGPIMPQKIYAGVRFTLWKTE